MVKEQDYTGFALNQATGERHALRHLPENGSEWQDQVYLLEEGDLMLGGMQGVMNLPIQELTNRTAYLKNALDNGAGQAQAKTKLITLEAANWTRIGELDELETESNYGNYIYILADSDVKADMIPFIFIAPENAVAAGEANISQTAQAEDGKLYIWADNIPVTDIDAQLTLFAVVSSIEAKDTGENSQTLDSGDISDIISGTYPDDDI